MNPSLAQARALLNATDAMLGALITITSQLRESVALLADTIDQIPQTAQNFSPLPPPKVKRLPTNLTLNELHGHLTLAGFPLSKSTINQYASTGSIPCTRSPSGQRQFDLTQVLDALASRPRCNSKPSSPHSSFPPPSTSIAPPATSTKEP